MRQRSRPPAANATLLPVDRNARNIRRRHQHRAIAARASVAERRRQILLAAASSGQSSAARSSIRLGRRDGLLMIASAASAKSDSARETPWRAAQPAPAISGPVSGGAARSASFVENLSASSIRLASSLLGRARNTLLWRRRNGAAGGSGTLEHRLEL
jgi:hypothetical protein